MTSTMINKAVPSMTDFLTIGRPWPAEMAEAVTAAPADVVRMLHLRSKLYTAELAPDLVLARNGRVPSLSDLLSDGNTSTAARLVRALRRQFATAVANFSQTEKLIAWHAFQVACCPASIRRTLLGYVGMTWLPGARRVGFAVGEEWRRIGQLRAVTLTGRRHMLRDGRVIDSADIKVHGAEVDSDASEVLIGGGDPVERTQLARSFNWRPKPSGDPDKAAVSLDNPGLIEAGLYLHRAMEDAALAGGPKTTRLAWPKFYFGFSHEDSVDVELSPVLTRRVVDEIDAWFRAGRPVAWPSWPRLASLDVLLEVGRPRDWEELVRRIGQDRSAFLAAAYWSHSVAEQDGLYHVPVEFFSRGSIQSPAQRAVQVTARFRPDVFRREGVASDALFPAASVVPGRHGMAGSAGNIRWDFAGVPAGAEAYFRRA